MKKQAGEQATLYYDSPNRVESGDYLRTGTGRLYLVQGVRVQVDGKHAGRQHLTTIVMPHGHDVEADAVVHTVHWYPRNRKART